MSDFLCKIKNFLIKKGVGFYLTFIAIFISFISLFVYLGGYVNSKYMSIAVVILVIFNIVLPAVMLFFKPFNVFAPVVAGLFSLAALCVFLKTVYMYFSEIFYGGISAEAIASISPYLIVFVIGNIINLILCIASVFLKQDKEEKNTNELEGIKNEK